MKRREFLHHAMIAGTAPFVLNASRALAQPTSDPNAKFILIRVHGAMDSTLGLHPVTEAIDGIAEQDLFLGYDPVEQAKKRVGGTEITLGPAAEGLSTFAHKMAVVRGLYVSPSDLGHPFAIQHMTSGFTQESAPSWAAYAGSVWSTPGSFAVTNAPLKRGTLSEFPTLLTSALRAQAVNAAKNQGAGGLGLLRRRDLGVAKFLDFINEREKLAKFLEVMEEASKDGATPSDADLVFASIYAGFTRSAQLDFENGILPNIDTHASHAVAHQTNQKLRWDEICKLLGKLESSGLLDSTLVAVITEFNRTPGLNPNGGKDHNNSDNAMALFGRGINGGKVFGDRNLFKRDDGFPYAYWAGKHFDFSTGRSVSVGANEKVADGLALLHPGDVWRSVAFSLDPQLQKYAPHEAFVIPGLFAG